MKEEFSKKITEKFKNFGKSLSDQQVQMFYDYYLLLIEWNQKFNLTAITDIDDVIEKHFLDSVLPFNDFKESNIIDIGAGAGFPSIPLKIMFPEIKLVMVDSVNKKVTFLNEVINRLQLKNTTAIHSRIEDLANDKKFRHSFDACVCRAVAALNVLSEYALPFIKNGGHLYAYKSQNYIQEIEEAQKAIKILGGKVEKTDIFDLNGNTRVLISVLKTSPTPPKFPRGKNKPRLEPII